MSAQLGDSLKPEEQKSIIRIFNALNFKDFCACSLNLGEHEWKMPHVVVLNVLAEWLSLESSIFHV